MDLQLDLHRPLLWLHEVLNSYATDSSGQKALQQLALHSTDDDGFYVVDGIILKEGKIWVGANAALQTKLIRAFHASALGGYSGIQTSMRRKKRKKHIGP